MLVKICMQLFASEVQPSIGGRFLSHFAYLKYRPLQHLESRGVRRTRHIISLFQSTRISMEVYTNFNGKHPWKSVEVDLLPWKLVEASMEMHRSFHSRWKWNHPWLPSNAASTNIFRESFYELPHTSTYYHLLP